jgi:molybdopterin-guanine dinucleotide biosynthesis adapter protein
VTRNWIQIVGAKKTGKTSLIEELTRKLVARGRTVTYIKHTHTEPELGLPDTDTTRVRAAGASTTVIAAESVSVTHRSGSFGVEELSFREASPGDIVLVEGFKSASGRKIVMTGGDLDFNAITDVVAVVGDTPPGFTGKTFTLDQVSELSLLVEKLVEHPDDTQWSTRLVVNGEEIPMNAFVQDVTAGAIRGITQVMRGVPEPETIELKSQRIRKTKAETEGR